MKSGGILANNSKGIAALKPAPLLLVLLASLIAGLLTPTPTLGGVSKKVSDVCQQSTDAAFRAKYCSAAKDLKEGYNANTATSAVWTGVSVACGAACGKATGGIVCQVAGYGGTAGEGILTKKFTDALTSEGSKFASGALAGKSDDAATTTAANGSTTTTEGTGGKVNADACQAAGTSALKAYGKYSDSKQNDKSLTALRDQTKDMNTGSGKAALAYSAGNTGGNAADESAATAGSTTCSDASIATAIGAIRCAATKDPSLPPYVKSEEFLKDLQKATGKSPDAFFANFESPAKSIFDSPVASGLSESGQHGLADSLSAMEGYADSKAAKVAANSNSTETMTAGAGAGHPRGAGDDDTGFDMNGMIAGVLGQMGGAADGENGAATNPGGRVVADRRPAGNPNAAEDRKISIFDRVQGRYGAVSARDRLGVQ